MKKNNIEETKWMLDELVGWANSFKNGFQAKYVVFRPINQPAKFTSAERIFWNPLRIHRLTHTVYFKINEFGFERFIFFLNFFFSRFECRIIHMNLLRRQAWNYLDFKFIYGWWASLFKSKNFSKKCKINSVGSKKSVRSLSGIF